MDWLRGAAKAVQEALPGKEPATVLTVAGRKILQGKLLADGGFAYVYTGSDVASGEQLAIRRVLLQDAEAFNQARTEIELLSSLCDHPHVVRYVDAEILQKGQSRASAQAVYLFELCTGGTLLAHLESAVAKAVATASDHGQARLLYCCPCLNQQDAIAVLGATAQALAYLSRLGMVHYDVKSENLLRGSDGLWKLGDFGSASERTYNLEGASKQLLSEAQEFIHGRCTAMYRAPELADVYLRWKIGPKVDIFALGCVVYATLTGQHPFPTDSVCANIAANFKVPPEATTSYEPVLLKWLHRLLAREPAMRPSAVKLAAEVQRFNALGEEPLESVSSTSMPSATSDATPGWVANFAEFAPPPCEEVTSEAGEAHAESAGTEGGVRTACREPVGALVAEGCTSNAASTSVSTMQPTTEMSAYAPEKPT